MNAWLTFCNYAFWFLLFAAIVAVLVAWRIETRTYEEYDCETT